MMTSYLTDEQQSFILPLSWTAHVQDEHLICLLGPFFFFISCSSANFWHPPQQRICSLTHIVYHVSICIFASFFEQKRNGAQMTPFPAQWHHLAVEDSFNSLSYPPCFPPAHFSHHPLRASSLVISLASQTFSDSTHSVFLRPFSAFSLSLVCSPSPELPLNAYASVFLSLPRAALFHPISLFVTDSSTPQEH